MSEISWFTRLGQQDTTSQKSRLLNGEHSRSVGKDGEQAAEYREPFDLGAGWRPRIL
jgi:hypothetical protein